MASSGSGDKPKTHRRSNNGCITCRIRRVKCDELKPSCKRCTSTGRRCDGYRLNPPAGAQQQNGTSMPMGMWVLSSNVCDTKSGRAACETRSRMFYHLFVELYTPLLSDYGTAGFWNSVVLQASASNESIKLLMIAASNLRGYPSSSPIVSSSSSSSYSSSSSSSHSIESRHLQNDIAHAHAHAHNQANVSFCIYYGRALQSLSRAPSPPIFVILIACVLLAICEELQHRSAEAQNHIQAGLKILAAHPDMGSTVWRNSIPLAEIASTFSRLSAPKPVMPVFNEGFMGFPSVDYHM